MSTLSIYFVPIKTITNAIIIFSQLHLQTIRKLQIFAQDTQTACERWSSACLDVATSKSTSLFIVQSLQIIQHTNQNEEYRDTLFISLYCIKVYYYLFIYIFLLMNINKNVKMLNKSNQIQIYYIII